jgi:hypothetical protein
MLFGGMRGKAASPTYGKIHYLKILPWKKRAPPKGGAQKEGKRVKEPKEKGLLLQPPLSHKPA